MRYDGQKRRTAEVQTQFPGLLASSDTESFWGEGWHPRVKTMLAQLYVMGIEDAYIKEKYGSLRVVVWDLDDGVPLFNLLSQYNILFERMCYHCGAPASMATRHGWKIPLCNDCDTAWTILRTSGRKTSGV